MNSFKFIVLNVILGMQGTSIEENPVAAKQVRSHKPTLYIIGDSTVNLGVRGKDGKTFGWGTFLKSFFDVRKIKVQNWAHSGESSRTYMLNQKYWPRLVARLREGDFVILQFGHNDSKRFGSIKGMGEETDLVEGQLRHTYGWYIRKYVSDTRSHGAIPIICSLISGNLWTDGKPNRNRGNYAELALEVAKQTKTFFIPLNDLTADRYEQLGRERVSREFFYSKSDSTHTSKAGAKLNASLVVEGIRSLKDCDLKDYLLEKRDHVASNSNL